MAAHTRRAKAPARAGGDESKLFFDDRQVPVEVIAVPNHEADGLGPDEYEVIGEKVSHRLAQPRIAHTKALTIAGLPHVSLHGLRRSFGTLCEWVEMPSGISAQIMGHKPSALAEKHYRRRPLDLLRKWHDQIEGWILEQAKVEFTTPPKPETVPPLVRSE